MAKGDFRRSHGLAQRAAVRTVDARRSTAGDEGAEAAALATAAAPACEILGGLREAAGAARRAAGARRRGRRGQPRPLGAAGLRRRRRGPGRGRGVRRLPRAWGRTCRQAGAATRAKAGREGAGPRCWGSRPGGHKWLHGRRQPLDGPTARGPGGRRRYPRHLASTGGAADAGPPRRHIRLVSGVRPGRRAASGRRPGRCASEAAPGAERRRR
mmetsp:Transcript_98291/g.306062  ORF Transcript_98291/g.306062 Transcript_98291/m.306062 type:complete len:213 (+) Transcript_98291:348-986(+)